MKKILKNAEGFSSLEFSHWEQHVFKNSDKLLALSPSQYRAYYLVWLKKFRERQGNVDIPGPTLDALKRAAKTGSLKHVEGDQ